MKNLPNSVFSFIGSILATMLVFSLLIVFNLLAFGLVSNLFEGAAPPLVSLLIFTVFNTFSVYLGVTLSASTITRSNLNVIAAVIFTLLSAQLINDIIDAEFVKFWDWFSVVFMGLAKYAALFCALYKAKLKRLAVTIT